MIYRVSSMHEPTRGNSQFFKQNIYSYMVKIVESETQNSLLVLWYNRSFLLLPGILRE